MTNTFKRKLAFYIFIVIAAMILVTCIAVAAKGQSTIGPENAMTDIPDGYYLSKSDTVKCIMVASSDVWYERMAPMSFNAPEPNFRPGYVVTQKHRFKRDKHARYVMYFNRVLLHKLVFLDTEKKELRNQIIWDYRIVKEQTDLDKAMSAEPMSIIGKPSTEFLVQVPTEPNNFGGFEIPTVNESLTTEPISDEIMWSGDINVTPEYNESQYVRISEFQELKQKLHDQKEAYRRELMAEVLARFCTFMSPDKAAVEAVKYADGLIKELEK